MTTRISAANRAAARRWLPLCRQALNPRQAELDLIAAEAARLQQTVTGGAS